MSKKLSTNDTFLNTEMTFKEENGRAVLRRAKDGDIIGSVRIGEGGNAEWGQISGEIENQTDLKNALDDKADNSSLQQAIVAITEQVNRLDGRIDGKQDELTAGEGITIEDNVISATGSAAIEWGNIQGNLANQKDLQSALDAKAGKEEVAQEKERAISAETELSSGISTLQDSKQHKLQAGANITITPGEEFDVISASGEVAPTEWGQIGGDIDNQTDLITKIEEGVSAEATIRQTADTALDGKITAETTARTNADTALGGRIDGVEDDLSAESAARTAEDTALNGRINGVEEDITEESRTREDHDVALENALQGEGQIREANDTALQEAIDEKQNKLPNAISSGKVLKSTNTSGGVEWGDITTGAAWGAISGRIGDQADLMGLFDTKAEAADLSDEITRAQGAEALLSENINAKANQSALDGEISARQNADTALGGRIDAAESGIGDVSDALDAEVIERQNADTALGGRITTETENREAEDNALSAAINLKQDKLVSGTNIKTVAGSTLLGSGNLAITKANVGLGNVDNTSDLNKPISNATQTALDEKEDALVFSANYGIGLENRTPVVEEATEGEITPFLDAYHPITPHNFKTALEKANAAIVKTFGSNYIEFTNGFIIQWGILTFESKSIASGSTSDQVEITYPKEMSALYTVNLTGRPTGTGGDWWIPTFLRTDNNIKISKKNTAPQSWDQNNSQIYWMVMGKI